MIFIIKCFRAIVLIFIVISTTFLPICSPAFFRCLSNSGTNTDLRTTSFIESTEVAFSDYVCHNRVQVLSIPELLLACSQDWTSNLPMIISVEAYGTNAYNRCAMCPAGHCVTVTGDFRRFNKGRSSKFRVVSWVRQTPEEGQRTYRPKRCGNDNKDEDNSPKNHKASSQKFRQKMIRFWA